MSMMTSMPACPTLNAIVAATGGTAAQELSELVELARLGAAVQSALNGSPVKLVKRGRGRPRTRPPQADPIERLRIQLEFLRAEAKGEGELEAAYQAAAERLSGGGKNALRVAGTLLARAHGRHRPNFLARLKTAGLLTDQLPTELARLYSKIEGKKFTSQTIKREAATK